MTSSAVLWTFGLFLSGESMHANIKVKSRRQVWSVLGTSGFFILVALVLTLMMMKVIFTMRDGANVIDDNRAIQASKAAASSMVRRLSGTVRDNAVWDEAYEAFNSGDRADWAYNNWGSTTEDYALYDGAVVSDLAGGQPSAYLKGKPFSPEDYFGPQFQRQIAKAGNLIKDPQVNFFKVDGNIILASSQAIQPYKNDTRPIRFVLTFFKALNVDVVDAIASNYQIAGLHLGTTPSATQLNLPIKDMNGTVIGYFMWPRQVPGTLVYNEVYALLIGAISLLCLFLVGILIAGSLEARRLSQLALNARRDASTDSLSGLLNRSGLLASFESMLAIKAESEKFILYLIDLDGFKAVNDTWGHAIGDDLIRQVAKTLEHCHPELCVAARFGGDEFAVIQAGDSPPEEICSSVLEIFRTPFNLDGRTVEVGASIGYAIATDVYSALELVRRADMALYEAKENGRGRASAYSHDLDLERAQRADLEGKLKLALDNDEVTTVYQPLADAATGEMRGVEALARWNTPSGPISPEVFIPLAEKSGLIDQLGLAVLKKAIRAAKDWPNINVSVNVSPHQLCNPNFPSEVALLLAQEDFSPLRLTLEVTEGVLMSNPDQASRAINALKAAGIHFALDDFGCGYASIGALRQFGFDRMKIDRSLVWAMDDQNRGVEILRATISLAVALGIPVTAEGIETDRQARILREAGCDQLQGFMIGRAMSANEISKLASFETEAARTAR